MNTATTLERSASYDGDIAGERDWSVGRGQHVQIVRPGLRRRTMEATVVSGALVASEGDPAGVDFELVIALPGAPDRPIRLSAANVRSMRLVSQGVYRQRGRP